MEMVNDINNELLRRDSNACLEIANKILQGKKYGFEREIIKVDNDRLIKAFTDMVNDDKFENEEQQEGARKLLNELLNK